jgi:ankyrin repeat protein
MSEQLVLAAAEGDFKLVEQLLNEGAHVDSVDEYGATALHMAVYYKHLPTILLLVDSGANVNSIDEDGDNPLHYAGYGKCDPGIMQLLCMNGTSKELKNNDGEIPRMR